MWRLTRLDAANDYRRSLPEDTSGLPQLLELLKLAGAKSCD